MRLRPIKYFLKQKDCPISRFAIRNATFAHHVVNRARLESQHLGELLHIEKPRMDQSRFARFVRDLNSIAHKLNLNNVATPVSCRHKTCRTRLRSILKRCAKLLCWVRRYEKCARFIFRFVKLQGMKGLSMSAEDEARRVVNHFRVCNSQRRNSSSTAHFLRDIRFPS